MNIDRLVFWKSVVPTRDDLRALLRDYFGAGSVVWDSKQSRFVCDIPLRVSDVEVFIREESVLVRTQTGSDFVDDVAKSFAARLAKQYDGEYYETDKTGHAVPRSGAPA